MKKIAVVCAAGKAGRLITDEAIRRGNSVTAFVRNSERVTNKAAKVVEKDLFAITSAELRGFDIVIDAFGAWTPDALPGHITSLRHLCDCVKNTNTRLLVVGGAGSLYVNPEHTVMVMDTEGFPDIFKPLASNMSKALEELRSRSDVKWTYISPAGNFQADGVRTGEYKLGGEELILNSKGESVISYADYAIAMVDEAESGKNIQKRISVVQK